MSQVKIINPRKVSTKVIVPEKVSTVTEEIKTAKEIANELHKPIIKKFERRKVIATEPVEIWTCDLCEMPNYDDYKYILTNLDVYTKYGWAIPLQNKKGPTVANAFENIITSSKRTPKFVWSDEGKEFLGKDFKAIMNKYNAEQYNTQSEIKSSVIERWNRTLKEKMERKMTELKLLEKPANWVDVLSDIVQEYNRKVHSTIKMSPVDAIKAENRKKLDENWDRHLYKNTNNNIDFNLKFEVGDIVRLYKYKTHFEKGYKSNWTVELFRIKRINYTIPITYIIEDKKGEEIKGCVYAEQMLKSKFEI